MLNPEENVLAEWFVDNRYTEVDSRSFYREIFPDGLFDVRDAKTPDVGRGLVQTIQKPTKKDDNQFQAVGKTITIYDDLTELYQTIDDSVKLYEQYQRKGVADRMQILTCTNGCSYMGHECLTENVYMMSAMIIEIDDIIYDENGMSGAYCYNPIGLKNMLNQMRPVEMLSHWKELKHQLCFFQILSLYNDFCNLISSIILSSSKTGLNSCASKHAQYIYGCPS